MQVKDAIVIKFEDKVIIRSVDKKERTSHTVTVDMPYRCNRH